MTPTTLRRLSTLRAVMGRTTIEKIVACPGVSVEITLRMSRPDLADLAWALGRSVEAAPGAYSLLEKPS